jgi:hypothetical protein
MDDGGRTERVIGYATPAARATRHSRYVIASLCSSGASVLWLAAAYLGVPLPFDVYKQHRVGGAAAMLGLIFALAAYCRANRRLGLAHVALVVALSACVAYCVILPA